VLDESKRDRRTERHSATRAEVLEVAWRIARSEGLAALSLREVASAMGMRAPSLYSYFSSKNAIYDAMYAQGAREFLQMQSTLALSGDPLVDVRLCLHLFARFCTQDPARYQLMFQRTIPGFEPSPESFALSVKGLEGVRQLLERSGITEPAAMDLLTAIGTGLIDQQLSNDPGGDRWLRLIDEAAEMFVTHQANHRGIETEPRSANA
jgi:AcrR family transcriptional regulator